MSGARTLAWSPTSPTEVRSVILPFWIRKYSGIPDHRRGAGLLRPQRGRASPKAHHPAPVKHPVPLMVRYSYHERSTTPHSLDNFPLPR